jgi:hypothetical protein
MSEYLKKVRHVLRTNPARNLEWRPGGRTRATAGTVSEILTLAYAGPK